MKYYLVKTENFFVDPHGSADFGGETKVVEEYKDDKDPYKNLKPGVSYEEVDDEELDSDGDGYAESEGIEWQGAEDGYNREQSLFEVKPLTKEEYLNVKAIIAAYDNL